MQTIQILRAESRTRTGDLLITNELLYQLSYFGSTTTLLYSAKIQSIPRVATAKVVNKYRIQN